jgi:hypothetical protein
VARSGAPRSFKDAVTWLPSRAQEQQVLVALDALAQVTLVGDALTHGERTAELVRMATRPGERDSTKCWSSENNRSTLEACVRVMHVEPRAARAALAALSTKGTMR